MRFHGVNGFPESHVLISSSSPPTECGMKGNLCPFCGKLKRHFLRHSFNFWLKIDAGQIANAIAE
jgi:hypothetical protein